MSNGEHPRTYKVRNWNRLQHFKNRRPPWIKLYRDVMDDREIFNLSPVAFRFLIFAWLMASEDKKQDGTLPSVQDMAFRLRTSEDEINQLLKQVDANLISTCHQDDTPEQSRAETE